MINLGYKKPKYQTPYVLHVQVCARGSAHLWAGLAEHKAKQHLVLETYHHPDLWLCNERYCVCECMTNNSACFTSTHGVLCPRLT